MAACLEREMEPVSFVNVDDDHRNYLRISNLPSHYNDQDIVQGLYRSICKEITADFRKIIFKRNKCGDVSLFIKFSHKQHRENARNFIQKLSMGGNDIHAEFVEDENVPKVSRSLLQKRPMIRYPPGFIIQNLQNGAERMVTMIPTAAVNGDATPSNSNTLHTQMLPSNSPQTSPSPSPDTALSTNKPSMPRQIRPDQGKEMAKDVEHTDPLVNSAPVQGQHERSESETPSEAKTTSQLELEEKPGKSQSSPSCRPSTATNPKRKSKIPRKRKFLEIETKDAYSPKGAQVSKIPKVSTVPKRKNAEKGKVEQPPKAATPPTKKKKVSEDDFKMEVEEDSESQASDCGKKDDAMEEQKSSDSSMAAVDMKRIKIADAKKERKRDKVIINRPKISMIPRKVRRAPVERKTNSDTEETSKQAVAMAVDASTKPNAAVTEDPSDLLSKASDYSSKPMAAKQSHGDGAAVISSHGNIITDIPEGMVIDTSHNKKRYRDDKRIRARLNANVALNQSAVTDNKASVDDMALDRIPKMSAAAMSTSLSLKDSPSNTSSANASVSNMNMHSGKKGRSKSKCRLFVENIPGTIGDNQLKTKFEKFGTVVSAKIMRDPATNVSKGCGFVTFKKQSSSKRAIAAMHHKTWFGQKISVSYVHNKTVTPQQLQSHQSPPCHDQPQSLATKNMFAVQPPVDPRISASQQPPNTNINNNNNRSPALETTASSPRKTPIVHNFSSTKPTMEVIQKIHTNAGQAAAVAAVSPAKKKPSRFNQLPPPPPPPHNRPPPQVPLATLQPPAGAVPPNAVNPNSNLPARPPNTFLPGAGPQQQQFPGPPGRPPAMNPYIAPRAPINGYPFQFCMPRLVTSRGVANVALARSLQQSLMAQQMAKQQQMTSAQVTGAAAVNASDASKQCTEDWTHGILFSNLPANVSTNKLRFNIEKFIDDSVLKFEPFQKPVSIKDAETNEMRQYHHYAIFEGETETNAAYNKMKDGATICDQSIHAILATNHIAAIHQSLQISSPPPTAPPTPAVPATVISNHSNTMATTTTATAPTTMPPPMHPPMPTITVSNTATTNNNTAAASIPGAPPPANTNAAGVSEANMSVASMSISRSPPSTSDQRAKSRSRGSKPKSRSKSRSTTRTRSRSGSRRRARLRSTRSRSRSWTRSRSTSRGRGTWRRRIRHNSSSSSASSSSSPAGFRRDRYYHRDRDRDRDLRYRSRGDHYRGRSPDRGRIRRRDRSRSRERERRRGFYYRMNVDKDRARSRDRERRRLRSRSRSRSGVRSRSRNREFSADTNNGEEETKTAEK